MAKEIMYAADELAPAARFNSIRSHRMSHGAYSGQQATEEVDAAMGMLLPMLLAQAGVYARAARAAQAERAGLPQADFSALEFIVAFDGLAAGQLAQLTGMSYGGTAAMADRLERSGYIERTRHPLDRRVVLLVPVMSRCASVLQERSRAMAALVRELCAAHGDHIVGLHQKMLHDCSVALRREASQWLNVQLNNT